MHLYVSCAMMAVVQLSVLVTARTVQSKDQVKPDMDSPSSTAAPLVDFHLNMPIKYSNMDPVSVLWMDNHKDLVRELFFSKSDKSFENRVAALDFYANAFKNIEQDRFNYFFDRLGSAGKKAAHLDAELQNDSGFLTDTENSSAEEDSDVKTGGRAHQPKDFEDDDQGVKKEKKLHRSLGSLCDIRNASFGMVIQYLKAGKICGSRTKSMRFGLGRK